MQGFEALQTKLGHVLALNAPGQSESHALVALPSYSVGETLLAHYGARMPALEHRYLAAIFLLHRIRNCDMIYVSTVPPGAEVLEYYLSLLPAADRECVRTRFHHVAVLDHSAHSVAQKLLARPELVAAIRERIGNRPGFLEPWNVTEHEAALALALGIPINGSRPELWPLGFKSVGRKLFRACGVPVAAGREDIRSLEEAATAILQMHEDDPDLRGVILKHDDSGAGDGNMVVGLADLGDDAALRCRLAGLPAWYVDDLAKGGVVEELVSGDRFASPSVQVDIRPGGEVQVLATHEQILGGVSGQVYMGCRFPGNPAYAPVLAEHGERVGEALARQGALGRFALDFAAVEQGGRWRVVALEINLRKGGTTHPFAALRNLVPGQYDAKAGLWRARAGGTRAYVATDNLANPSWTGLRPTEVIRRVRDAGLQFDHSQGTGVVLLMLSGLAIDGRFGYVAIERDPDRAQSLADAVLRAMGR
jgi:hypothetical protein